MDTPAAQQLIVSVSTAQRLLGGIGRTKVYDLINRGELVKVNVGRRGLITTASIESYVARLSGETATATG